MHDSTLSDAGPQRTTTRDDPIPGVGPWLSNYTHAMEGWMQAGATMTGRATKFYEEVMTFWQSRLREDMDTWKALSCCRNPSEIFECQRQFTHKTAVQYCDEASKLASQIIGAMGNAFSTSGEQHPA
jgi:hypothetical protein